MADSTRKGVEYSWWNAPLKTPPEEVHLVNKGSHLAEPLIGLLCIRGSTSLRDKRVLFLLSLFKSVAFAYRVKSRARKDLWTVVTALLSWLTLRRLIKQRTFVSMLAKLIIPVQLISYGCSNPEGPLGSAILSGFCILQGAVTEVVERVLKRTKSKVVLRDFPATPDNVTAEWVGRCLQQAGVVNFADEVSGISLKALSNGSEEEDAGRQTGFVGETLRINIDYKGASEGPTSLVAKFATKSPKMRMFIRSVNVYLREALFYSRVAPKLEPWAQANGERYCLHVPQTFGIGYDDKLAISTILMEDAAPLVPGDEVLGGTWEQACSVAIKYARFHSVHWSESLDSFNNKYPELSAFRCYDWMDLFATPMLIQRGLDEVLGEEDLKRMMSPSIHLLLKTLLHHFPLLIKHLKSSNITFIHADARMENMLWPQMGMSATDPRMQHTENRIAHSGLSFSNLYEREELEWLAVDWQTSCKGLGISDLSYFVSMDLTVAAPEANNNACDKTLVKGYHDELMRTCEVAREAGYSFDECYAHYQLTTLLAVLIPITVMRAESIGGDALRRNAVRSAMFGRCLSAIVRNKSDEALYSLIDKSFVHRTLTSPVAQVNHKWQAPDIIPEDEVMLSHHTEEMLKDRNGYDRWFLNGYSKNGSVFFAAALGMYPARGVVDAAFSVVVNGKQHNARFSRRYQPERDSPVGKNAQDYTVTVGPFKLTVTEPLEKVLIEINVDKTFHAHLEFTSRFPAHFEPPYDEVIKGIGKMVYDRMTQLVSWEGHIFVQGKSIPVVDFFGTRDRSWGIRPHTEKDFKNRARSLFASETGRDVANAIIPPAKLPQFYWFWTPLNLEKCAIVYFAQQDARGNNRVSGCSVQGDLTEDVVAPDAPSVHKTFLKEEQTEVASQVVSSGHSVIYMPDTRHAKQGCISLVMGDGRRLRLEFEPLYPFFMSGIGYAHDTWSHGTRHEGTEVCFQYDTIDTFLADRNAPLHWHIQEVSKFYLYDGATDELLDTGVGVVEQLMVGPHAPSKFKCMYDV